jgi:hypothetical protein
MAASTEGGFIQGAILSPPPSTTRSSTITAPLPKPRAHPLKFGGAKESAFIRHMDEGIQNIQRKIAKGSIANDQKDSGTSGNTRGYESFVEVGHDIDQLVDVTWVSGTRRFCF